MNDKIPKYRPMEFFDLNSGYSKMIEAPDDHLVVRHLKYVWEKRSSVTGPWAESAVAVEMTVGAGGAAFQIEFEGVIVTSNVVLWNERLVETMWEHISLGFFLCYYEMPAWSVSTMKAHPLPWTAVLTAPSMSNVPREWRSILRNLGHCIAFAILRDVSGFSARQVDGVLDLTDGVELSSSP